MSRSSRRAVPAALAAAALAAVLPAAASAADPVTSRVSVTSAGVQSAGDSYAPELSGDGRVVAFTGWEDDLVPGDANTTSDAFVHDRSTGITQRVNVATDGTQGDIPAPGYGTPPSYAGDVSADGRVVAFQTDLALVPDDTNRDTDAYVRDLVSGVTSRVSVSSSGAQGRHASGDPVLSADGRLVAFWSAARNLVPGDTNRLGDVFVHDRETGRTRRVSVSSRERQGDNASMTPALSADGRFVAFVSYASNLVERDTNDLHDVFVRDLRTGRTARVNLSSGERQANGARADRHRYSDVGGRPALSADGRFVAFTSSASNLVRRDRNRDYDVFVRDRERGTTSRVSVSVSGGDSRHRPVEGEPEGQDPSSAPSISADGRYVAFQSDAYNLTRSDPNPFNDVFIRDRRTRRTVRVPGGEGPSESPALSADGRWLAWESEAEDLVPGDDNDSSDVFVRGPLR